MWVKTYLKQKNKTNTEKGLSMLLEFLGSDLSKIANELDKLILLLENEKKITEQHMEDNIGISKDYNIFELQEAIGQRNHRKANLIAQYFIQNPNQHPFAVTVTVIFQYFTKLLLYKSLVKQSSDRRGLAADMGVSPYYLKNYAKDAGYYHIEKIKENIAILREYDLKSKGVDSISVSNGDLLKEMLFRLMN
jgi:DNA polymerase-3 subunit delta